jgi:hypothetical protein
MDAIETLSASQITQLNLRRIGKWIRNLEDAV